MLSFVCSVGNVPLAAVLSVSMAGAAQGVEFAFRAFGWIPPRRHATVSELHLAFKHTFVGARRRAIDAGTCHGRQNLLGWVKQIGCQFKVDHDA